MNLQGEIFRDCCTVKTLEKFASLEKSKNPRLMQIHEYITGSDFPFMMVEMGMFSAFWKALGADNT